MLVGHPHTPPGARCPQPQMVVARSRTLTESQVRTQPHQGASWTVDSVFSQPQRALGSFATTSKFGGFQREETEASAHTLTHTY